VPQFRTVGKYRLLPPFTSWAVFTNAPTPALILRTLHLYADDRDEGRSLFSGPIAQRNRSWTAFHNYMRQAFAYYDAAAATSSSAAALLYYYSALNFGKAELLVRGALAPNEEIHHGLTFRPTSARSVRSDHITVRRGVFPRLYTERTDYEFREGAELPVKRILANIPEMGWEVEHLRLGGCNTTGIVHVVAWNGGEAWSIIATPDPRPLGAGVTAALFGKHYERVQPPLEWRRILGVSLRWTADNMAVYQSKTTRPEAEHQLIQSDVAGWLTDLLDDPAESDYDANIVGSMWKSEFVRMPASLARYGFMFYLSSLVRYSPSQLDPVRRSSDGWLANAFVEQCGPMILRDALNGITQTRHFFLPPGHFRT
jgi:hypothetical protein